MDPSSYSDFYRGKLFSGPMVKASCEPFRLLCLEYGADGAYGPAVSADAILNSHLDPSQPRTLFFGTPEKQYVHFRAAPEEQGKLVFQLLTNDPSKAVEAAQKVIGFVDALDLNCGCPESFATSRGAGSALMYHPQTVSEVIKALRRNFNLPISVKHRLLPNIEQSIQFAVACEQAGASAVAVHGRLKEQKHSGSVAYNDMKIVFDNLSVAKIGNGGVKSREGAQKMMEETGCESVIISSAALKNPSIFRKEGILDPVIVLRRYMEIAKNVCMDGYDRREWKYIPLTMIGKYKQYTRSPTYKILNEINDFNEFKAIIDQPDPFQLDTPS